MSKKLDTLEVDFLDRPQWLQDAMTRALEKGELTAADIKELVILCKAEAGILPEGEAKPVFRTIPKGAFTFSSSSVTLRLEGISEFVGINALSPKVPLKMEAAPVTIVYGANGSGKSGYVRTLKHVCGCKVLPPLLRNVFKKESPEQSCKIDYSLDGAAKGAQWTFKGGPLEELRNIAIYDNTCTQFYVEGENEVTFEPRVLRLFSILVDACDKVDDALRKEAAAKGSALPKLPAEYAATAKGKWYATLARTVTQVAIDSACLWEDAQEKELSALQVRAAEKSPAEKAIALRKVKTRTEQFLTAMRAIYDRLTNDAFDALQTARDSAKQKRKAATVEIEAAFKGGLVGIGSETWRAMWLAACEYSSKEAYKGQSAPVVGEGARCVLCQQDLSPAATMRLTSFEAFVKGELENAAKTAETAVTSAVNAITSSLSLDALSLTLDQAGIEEAALREAITAFYTDLDTRKKAFTTAENKSLLPAMPSQDVFTKIQASADGIETKAKGFDEDAKAEKKTALQDSIKEVNAHKWVAQQKAAVESEVARLTSVNALDEARKKANTRWLSDTKSALSETIVTAAYIGRFNDELKALNAGKIRVKLLKTRAPKGQVLHRIFIDGADESVAPMEVLSEGQLRIISIAAFLADMASAGGSSPFIFDDPVSSLDQDFEEATASRLLSLSKTRQVIVFTHRLSMVSLLEDAAEKAGVDPNMVTLRHESWGAGEPDKTGRAQDKRPDKAINTLLNDRLPKVRKTLETVGRAEYEVGAKALCSDLRITLERLVEIQLLNDVVQRFRRSVNTLGKIEGLARITAKDCKFFDDFMTKYSFYEHSQPSESPGKIPEPEELESDLKALAAWCEEFKKRPVPAA